MKENKDFCCTMDLVPILSEYDKEMHAAWRASLENNPWLADITGSYHTWMVGYQAAKPRPQEEKRG
jgi:hypothetical protein